ncbi:MAG: MarR family winged helix-turn-helix transcriptional regulator [Pseudonocardiaceae bacterium]
MTGSPIAETPGMEETSSVSPRSSSTPSIRCSTTATWARAWARSARLGRAHAYVDAAMHTVFVEHGLTRQGWDVLTSLRRIGPPYRLTPTELHQALMRTAGAITHTLHRLEYAGLIERLPNEHDGRSLLVALTPRGTDLLAQVGPHHLSNERRILDPLTTDEQATLAALLRKLLLAFERDQTTPKPQPRAFDHAAPAAAS